MSSPDPRPTGDEELVRVFAARPETMEGRAAAAELLGRYQRRVYLWCFRYVREHERALDLAQDVLVKAYRGLNSFREGSRFGTWLFAIARNHCISTLRTPPLLLDTDEDLESHAHPSLLADEEIVQREDERSIVRLIEETLDPHEQTAIRLRCFEKMPVDEISRLLDLRSATGARGLLQTARRKLRTALKRQQQLDRRSDRGGERRVTRDSGRDEEGIA